MNRIRGSALFFLTCALVAGCSEPKPDLLPVEGVVTLNGTPVAGATVTFVPVGTTPGNGSTGRTGPNGRYTLTSIRGGEGAFAGQYKVVINRKLTADGAEFSPDAHVDPMTVGLKEAIPAPYSDQIKSPLKANVAAGGGPIDFTLKGQVPKQ